MKNLTKMILAAALIITTCSLFAHNGDFRKRDNKESQSNCPRQHRDGGDGNQQYSGEQYSGEQYPGEFDNSNCQSQKQQCGKKSNCAQGQKNSNCKGRGIRKRDGKGPHNEKQTSMNQNQPSTKKNQQETAEQQEQAQD